MRRKRLLWKLFPVNLLITVIALISLTIFASNSLHKFIVAESLADLEARALLVENDVRNLLAENKLDQLNDFCKRLGKKASTRITVILGSGKVVADSLQEPGKMESHANRAEVINALGGRIGSAIRFSITMQEKMMYVAIPLTLDGPSAGQAKVNGVLRMSTPITTFDQALKEVYGKIAFGSLVIAFITAIITLTVLRRLSRPLEAIKRSAERFGRGDFSRQLTVSTDSVSIPLEVASLVDTMNWMAEQLNDRITTAERQHQQLDAVFASMVESVIAVDRSENVISINQAAAALFNVKPAEIQGKNIKEFVGKSDILHFVNKTMSGYKTIEEDIVFSDQENKVRYLQAHGTRLRNLGGQHYGALIVLNDITRLQRLEEVRRDFVANVSHELKTPITSIKGFVETLLDGALEDQQDTERFLGIINKQTDRLNSIVDDLLTLSRLEQEGKDKAELIFQKEQLSEILYSAIDACKVDAEDKNIEVKVTCPKDLLVFVNGALLEQAIINLVVNSIKYSDEDSKVDVEADRDNGEVVISVRDFGVGIAAEHLPRLFERFYRSDKARSRKLGGTGLGLAIVKHIVQVHEGNVTVESTPGKATVFSIRLPGSQVV
ncbi:MAG: PAS domain-containing protein [Proteobacteria bacterium]|nr:PAS domain-containing protein [Pseudomonadota bacterium]